MNRVSRWALPPDRAGEGQFALELDPVADYFSGRMPPRFEPRGQERAIARAKRPVRIATVAGLHYDGTAPARMRALLAQVSRRADILAICGGLTRGGTSEQAHGFVAAIAGFDLPVVAVLGSRDCAAGNAAELSRIFTRRGIHLLDGDSAVICGVGFAGVTGSGGSDAPAGGAPFVPRLARSAAESESGEALKLTNALGALRTATRLVLLGRTPIPGTVRRDAGCRLPLLGSSALVAPIERYRATAVFYGDAYVGSPEEATPGGVPVYNVAQDVLRRHFGHSFRLWTADPA